MSLGQDHCYKGCHVQFKNKVFSFTNKAGLEVKCNGSIVKSVRLHFAKHIRLLPPDIPSVAQGNLSWSPGASLPRHMTQFTFELQFKGADEPWESAPPRPEFRRQVELKDLSLQQGGRYQARVRVKPVTTGGKSSYAVTWSDWSPVLTWTSDVGDPPPTPSPPGVSGLPLTDMEIGLLSGGLCLAAVVIMWLIRKAHTLSCCSYFRTKSQHIPDPSRYFQPLHSVHGGDFQKWLSPTCGPEPFGPPQPSDCISPVEVAPPMLDTEPWQTPNAQVHLQAKSSGAWRGSGQSSGYSNMGYFYSECQPGLVHIESCPIYFMYPPEGEATAALGLDTSGTSGTSYERLEQIEQFHSSGNPDLYDQPLTPDSGFGTEVNDEGEGMNEDEEWKQDKEEHPCIVHFQRLGMSISIQTPLSSPKSEDTTPALTCNFDSSPPEGSLARSASMIIQPCGSGYMTIKEMQNTYSNKSI
ncbi:interleukin-2 receptor subunit beta isoform X2 [Clupea harengus]|nr:interleukin-2 receptor subunit beta isoform X2 [Clupea harengus]